MHRSSGFTLIELMVVIFVIGLVTALGVPAAINHTDHYGPRYAADVLYGDLQLARMRAARNNQRCRFLFDTPNNDVPGIRLNQYLIQDVSINNVVLGTFKIGDLTAFRGNILFRALSPLVADPPPLNRFDFMPQGLIANVRPIGSNSVYLTNQGNTKDVRVFTSLSGGSGILEMNPADIVWR